MTFIKDGLIWFYNLFDNRVVAKDTSLDGHNIYKNVLISIQSKKINS